MQCDLCEFRGSDTIRVNGWVVCNKCASGDVLKQALEAKAQLEKLEQRILEADTNAARAMEFKKQAQSRIDVVMRELEAAINALIPVIAQSTRAEEAAAKARSLLAAFNESEGAKKLRPTSS